MLILFKIKTDYTNKKKGKLRLWVSELWIKIKF
jgi:hypothetical protein